MPQGVSNGTNPWADCRSSGRIAEMRSGPLVSGRPFLPVVSVHRYPHWQSYRPRPVVAEKSLLILWVMTSPPVPPSRVPRRLTTVSLHTAAQAADQIADLFRTTHEVKTLNRWQGAGVSDVETSSLLPTSRMRRVRYLWCWTYASHMSVGEVALTLVLISNCITQLT